MLLHVTMGRAPMHLAAQAEVVVEGNRVVKDRHGPTGATVNAAAFASKRGLRVLEVGQLARGGQVMPRPIPEWKSRNPVEAVTHEPQSSGLLEAWGMLGDGPVRLDDLAREAMLSASYTGPADTVRAIADALDTVRPVVVRLRSVPLVRRGECYEWPEGFAPAVAGWRKPLNCTALAALAVGVALWGRLPTADEVAAWMDEDEPQVAAVEVV